MVLSLINNVRVVRVVLSLILLIRHLLLCQELEGYERAFNGEDKRWRAGSSQQGARGGGGQGSYVNARALS